MAHTRMTLVDRLATWVATVFGIGHAPVAPGTFGTLAAVPIAWLTADWPVHSYLALTIAVTLLGVAASHALDVRLGEHDSQRIVVDEVAGYLWTCVLLPRHDWRWLLAAFVLFRALDIGKPPPIGWIDRRVGGGWGVMLDDVAAGVLAATLLHAVAIALA
jgi:phosphatidylglycerophosphatase A